MARRKRGDQKISSSVTLEQPHYPNNPIVEAIIDIRVGFQPGVSLDSMEKLFEREVLSYPKHAKIMGAEIGASLGAQVSASARQLHTGYIFFSGDQKQAFQARLDGFTFTRLTPYDRWDSFRDEARRLWSIYRSGTNPATISRVAVRYINRLDIPLQVRDLKDYLRTVPEISPALPQGLSGYFMHLEIPQEDLKAMLHINQGIIPPCKPEVVSILLDIDLFREYDIPTEEEGLWGVFEHFRPRKNEIFKSCITEKMEDLIN